MYTCPFNPALMLLYKLFAKLHRLFSVKIGCLLVSHTQQNRKQHKCVAFLQYPCILHALSVLTSTDLSLFSHSSGSACPLSLHSGLSGSFSLTRHSQSKIPTCQPLSCSVSETGKWTLLHRPGHYKFMVPGLCWASGLPISPSPVLEELPLICLR